MKARLQRALGHFVPPAVVGAVVPLVFPRTHRFLYGELPTPVSPAPNIVQLTLNKAASQHIAKIIATLLKEKKYSAVWPNSYAFFHSTPYIEYFDPEKIRKHPNITRPKRIFIAGVGRPPPTDDLIDGTRQIIAIRDPRDILVSDYYSMRYYHAKPSARDKIDDFALRRATAVVGGMPGYVRERAQELRDDLERYMEISRHGHCLAVLRYEDFLEDFPGWVRALEAALGLPADPARMDRLAGLAPRRPDGERPTVKVRAARSGQFRDKLDAETIAALDEMFAPVLAHFGYATADAGVAMAG